MTIATDPMNGPALVLLGNTHELTLGPATPKPTAITDGQLEANVVGWVAVDGKAEAGVWEATPGSFTAIRDGYHEVCQVLSGKATVVSDSGDAIEVGAGDLFVMPAGWSGTWHVHETLRKTYVTIVI